MRDKTTKTPRKRFMISIQTVDSQAETIYLLDQSHCVVYLSTYISMKFEIHLGIHGIQVQCSLRPDMRDIETNIINLFCVLQ